MGRRERTVKFHNPRWVTHKWEIITITEILPKAWGFWLSQWVPQPGVPAPRWPAPRTWPWRPAALTFWSPRRLGEIESILRGHTQNLPWCETQVRNSHLKGDCRSRGSLTSEHKDTASSQCTAWRLQDWDDGQASTGWGHRPHQPAGGLLKDSWARRHPRYEPVYQRAQDPRPHIPVSGRHGAQDPKDSAATEPRTQPLRAAELPRSWGCGLLSGGRAQGWVILGPLTYAGEWGGRLKRAPGGQSRPRGHWAGAGPSVGRARSQGLPQQFFGFLELGSSCGHLPDGSWCPEFSAAALVGGAGSQALSCAGRVSSGLVRRGSSRRCLSGQRYRERIPVPVPAGW